MKTVTLNGKRYVCPLSDRFRRHDPAERERMDESGDIEYPVLLYRDATLRLDHCVLDGEGRLEAAARTGAGVDFRHLGEMTTEAAYERARAVNDARRHDDPEAIRKRRAERVERVAAKRAEGKSIRTIAVEEGISKAQVERDIEEMARTAEPPALNSDDATGVPPGTPVSSDKASGVSPDTPELPLESRGRDGKTYRQAPKAKAAANGRPEGAAIAAPSGERLAGLLGISPDSVDLAGTVLRDGVPELVKAVDAGVVSLGAAAEVAKLPKAEQKKVVAGAAPAPPLSPGEIVITEADERAELEKRKPPVDATGRVIPPALRDTFFDAELPETIAELAALLAALDARYQRMLRSLSRKPYPYCQFADALKKLSDIVNPKSGELPKAVDGLRAGVPFAVCPCGGGVPGCRTCRGGGVLPEWRAKELGLVAAEG